MRWFAAVYNPTCIAVLHIWSTVNMRRVGLTYFINTLDPCAAITPCILFCLAERSDVIRWAPSKHYTHWALCSFQHRLLVPRNKWHDALRVAVAFKADGVAAGAVCM